MKKAVQWSGLFAFLALCVAVIWFLHLFTVADDTIQYIDWQSAVRIGADGTETPYALDGTVTNMPDQEGSFRFTAVLPEGLGEGKLCFETSGLALSVTLNGETIYSSSVVLPEDMLGLAQANLPLPAGTAGELTVTCTILDDSNAMFPPLLRFVPSGSEETQWMAYANLYGIPAGVGAVALLLVAGLFLLSAVRRQTEWSLLPLALALVGLTAYRLIQSCGYYFLPAAAAGLLSWKGFAWLAPLALAAYLAMNRRRAFWRLLGLAAAWSAVGLLAACLISLAGGTGISPPISARRSPCCSTAGSTTGCCTESPSGWR